MEEPEFIEKAIEKARKRLAEIPQQFRKLKRDASARTDQVLVEAGVIDTVKSIEKSLEDAQKKLQSEADVLRGQIQALEVVHKHFHQAPVPQGVTHMYGIELASLDPETRLRVMHGQEAPAWEETINILGGDPERPDWDGSEEEEHDPSTLDPEDDEDGEDYYEDEDEHVLEVESDV